jgi:hypothetical protein
VISRCASWYKTVRICGGVDGSLACKTAVNKPLHITEGTDLKDCTDYTPVEIAVFLKLLIHFCRNLKMPASVYMNKVLRA